MANDPRCESCGEPLLWVENVKTGARLPLVRTPFGGMLTQEQVKPGMVVVSPSREKGRILTLEDIGEWSEGLQAAIADGRLHSTHFADCPQRDEWSGGSRRAA